MPVKDQSVKRKAYEHEQGYVCLEKDGRQRIQAMLVVKGCEFGNQLCVLNIPHSQQEHFLSFLREMSINPIQPWMSTLAKRMCSQGYQSIGGSEKRLRTLCELYSAHREHHPDPLDANPSQVAIKQIPMTTGNIVLFTGIYWMTHGVSDDHLIVLHLNLNLNPMCGPGETLPLDWSDCKGGPLPWQQEGVYNRVADELFIDSETAKHYNYGWNRRTIHAEDLPWFEADQGPPNIKNFLLSRPNIFADDALNKDGCHVFESKLTLEELAMLETQIQVGTQWILTTKHRNMRDDHRRLAMSMSAKEFCKEAFDRESSVLPDEILYWSGPRNIDVPYRTSTNTSPGYGGFSKTNGHGDMWWHGAPVIGKLCECVSFQFGFPIYPRPARFMIRSKASISQTPHHNSPIFADTTEQDATTATKPKKQKQVPASATTAHPAAQPQPPTSTPNAAPASTHTSVPAENPNVIQFMNNHGKWQSFSDKLTGRILEVYSADKHSSKQHALIQYSRSGKLYMLDFNKMIQEQVESKKTRLVRLCFSKPNSSLVVFSPSSALRTSTLPNTMPEPGNNRLEFKDDNGDWKPFNTKLAKEICSFRRNSSNENRISYGDGQFDYTLEFTDSEIVQINISTGKRREVRFPRDNLTRLHTLCNLANNSYHESSVQFLKDDATWSAFHANTALGIWNAYIRGATSARYTHDGNKYEICFFSRKQTNLDTKTQRPIRFPCEGTMLMDYDAFTLESDPSKIYLMAPDNTRVEILNTSSSDKWMVCKPEEAAHIYYCIITRTKYHKYTVGSTASLEFDLESMTRRSFPLITHKVRTLTVQNCGDCEWMSCIGNCTVCDEDSDCLGKTGVYGISSDPTMNGLPSNWIRDHTLSFSQPSTVHENIGSKLWEEVKYLFQVGKMPSDTKIVSVQRCVLPSKFQEHYKEIQRMLGFSKTVQVRKVWHGCTPEVADIIEKFGPDVAFAGSRTACKWGVGNYGVSANSAYYAHHYTEEDVANGRTRTMFLFNAIMDSVKQGSDGLKTMPDGNGGHHMLADNTSNPWILCAIMNAKFYPYARVRYTASSGT